MKEWFRLNSRMLPTPHDAWVSMKRPFDRGRAAEVEALFLDALSRIRAR
jgi:hypothetical protein